METTIEKGSAIADPTILTESTYNTLYGMLKSSDESNHKMAQAILNQIKIQESIYFIWKLAKHFSYKMVYLRTKASRQFVNNTNLWRLSILDETGFAEYLDQKGWLTLELYQLLMVNVITHLKQRNRSHFYDFHITIKEEYKHLYPEDKLQKLIE